MLIWEKIHGHLALLGIALALHPPLALRRAKRPSPRTRLAGYLATLTCLGTNIMGWVIYPAYRQELRRQLYLADLQMGQMFEIKEHLAWYALALSLAGGVMMVACARQSSLRLVPQLRLVYGLSALMAMVSAALGIYLATMKGFDYGLP
ncbi:MAG: hypothetical protein ACE366_12275 [Bradymonadia bacterium]